MRILHVTPTFRPAIGGIEAVIENLCLYLRRRGVEADVAHVEPGLEAAEVRLGDARIFRVPLHGHAFAGIAPGLAKIAACYDMLHVHDPQLLSISANVRAFARGIPAVLSTHGGFHHTKRFSALKRLHEKWLMPWALSHYQLVLATSKADMDYFQQFCDRIVLAENGVDVSRFSTFIADSDRSVWNWLYWGRLSRNKRLDLVVEVAEQARELGYPVALTICGSDFDGSGKELSALCARRNQTWVRFLPAASEEDLTELVGSAALYLTGSEHEGFGLTIIEALAGGLPVVCRNMPPLNEFVDESCGLLLAFDGGADDRSRLAHFLATFAERHPSLAENSRRRAGRFDWSTAVDRFLVHYRTVLDQ